MPPQLREFKTRDVTMEIKVIDDVGQFEGLASVYDIPDQVSDVVMRGAFSKTLQESKGKVPILWNHKLDEPIGFGDATDDAHGLRIAGKLNLQVGRAREIHALMKQAKSEGHPFGLSFGYDTIKADYKGPLRHVREVKLWEISPTLFPAHRMAQIASVKQATKYASMDECMAANQDKEDPESFCRQMMEMMSRGPKEGKPFGDYESFEDCVSQNQDKDNPEGFCAALHERITGEWPGAKSYWDERVQSLFDRTPRIKVTREEIAKICPSCGEKMEKMGFAALYLGPDTIKQMPDQLMQGLCDRYGSDEGFFTRCNDNPPSEADDPESFCAWLHEQCTGQWPGEGRTMLDGVRHVLRATVLPTLEEIARKNMTEGQAKVLDDGMGHLQQAVMALTVLLLDEPAIGSSAKGATRTPREPDLHSLMGLLQEMQTEMRSRRGAAV